MRFSTRFVINCATQMAKFDIFYVSLQAKTISKQQNSIQYGKKRYWQ